MWILSKARKLSSIALKPQIITSQNRYLFILSHMRSRSTVLSHILGSNPEIRGYREQHRSYQSRLDLLKLRAELCREFRCYLSREYLLDKILHEHYRVSEQMLDFAQPKLVFLLREPESTLKSIIDMGQRTGVAWYRDPRQATDYYCSRLADLANFARRAESGYFYLEADDLVNRTDRVLAELSEWLKLRQGLDKNYSSFPKTGKRYYGDSSEHIKAGVIKQTQGHPEVKLPPELLRRADASYRHCREVLTENGDSPSRVKQTA